MELEQLIEREKVKYNLLYASDEKYGGRSGRPKTFLRGNDEIHTFTKKALSNSKTLLDIGCGQGFFVDFFKQQYPKMQISCIDIAAKELQKRRPDLNIIEASADELPFDNDKFDIVTHLDGMEHIPVEIEEQVFREEYRVSRKYIYHQIATHPVKRDQVWIDKGLGAIHINMKTAEEWRVWFEEMSLRYGAKILNFVDYRLWVHVLLEKI
jgi:ubiquinone/menaquinone biosynthesis C-methylase UbiE